MILPNENTKYVDTEFRITRTFYMNNKNIVWLQSFTICINYVMFDAAGYFQVSIHFNQSKSNSHDVCANIFAYKNNL